MRAVLAPARLDPGTVVSLAFVDDAAIRELNARHRGRDRVTDVLAFGAALPPGTRGAATREFLERAPDGTLELGDVVVAPEQARRQARRRGWALAREVAFLAAHGALHLIGYEDDTMPGFREMRRIGEEAVTTSERILRRKRKQN